MVKARNTMPTQLLNDDGTASMATAIMSSHHAFRRDLACFAEALTAIARGDTSRAAEVAAEWTSFHAALHGHHTAEDNGLFPDLRARHPSLAADLDTLDAHHRAIDPLLERGDRAFAAPLRVGEAIEVVRALDRALAEHLDLEERVAIPHLRDARQFPAAPTDDVLAMYAEGFAWSTAGLAGEVIDALDAMLPPGLVARLAEARRTFAARCLRVWGYAHAGASTTSAPEPFAADRAVATFGR
jgi:iron-sulfur cluster repair protein YtfE (RIC family)